MRCQFLLSVYFLLALIKINNFKDILLIETVMYSPSRLDQWLCCVYVWQLNRNSVIWLKSLENSPLHCDLHRLELTLILKFLTARLTNKFLEHINVGTYASNVTVEIFICISFHYISNHKHVGLGKIKRVSALDFTLFLRLCDKMLPTTINILWIKKSGSLKGKSFSLTGFYNDNF